MRALIRKRATANATLGNGELDGLLADLQEISAFTQGAGFPIYLVGGVGMSLSLGHFYRSHKDIDLMIALDDLGAFCEHAGKNGYAFHRRIGRARLMGDLYALLFRNCLPGEVIDRRGDGVKLLQDGSPVMAYGRTRCLDVYVFSEQGDGISLLESGIRIPMRDFSPAQQVHLPDGSNLLVPPPNYFWHMKNARSRPVDVLDRARLAEYCSAPPVQI